MAKAEPNIAGVNKLISGTCPLSGAKRTWLRHRELSVRETQCASKTGKVARAITC